MASSRATVVPGILTLLFSLIALPVSGQVRIDRYGITLRVPQSWEQIPDSLVAAIEGNATKTLGIDIDYVAGFQPEPGEQWLALPYVLFQVEDVGRATSDEEYLALIEEGLFDDPSEEIAQRATDSGVLDAASFGQPVWNPNSRILWTSFELNSPERGRFQGLTAQTLFRDGALMLHYYFPVDQPLGPVMDIAEQTLLATGYDPGKEYSESAAAAADRDGILSRILNRGASGALAGGVIATLIGIVGWLLSYFRRTPDRPETHD